MIPDSHLDFPVRFSFNLNYTNCAIFANDFVSSSSSIQCFNIWLFGRVCHFSNSRDFFPIETKYFSAKEMELNSVGEIIQSVAGELKISIRKTVLAKLFFIIYSS